MTQAVAWSASVNLGQLFTLLLVAGVAGFFAWKGKQAKSADDRASTAEQTGRDFRDYYLAEHERVESLERELGEQREAKHAALTEVARLNMATDLTAVTKQIADVAKSIAEFRSESSEHFAAFRGALTEFTKTQETQTAALEAIVARLNDGSAPSS